MFYVSGSFYDSWLAGLGSLPLNLLLGTEASGPAQPSYPLPGIRTNLLVKQKHD